MNPMHNPLDACSFFSQKRRAFVKFSLCEEARSSGKRIALGIF